MKVRYYVEPKSFFARTSVVCMALSFVVRAVWSIIWHDELSGNDVYLQCLLPLAASALFVLFVLTLGKKALWTTFVSVLLGVLFFITKAFSFVWWHQLLCTLLYFVVALLYAVVVFGIRPLRGLLIPLFGLPLLFHIFVEDLILKRSVYTASQWVAESSVLLIMAALLCISIAMKKKPLSDAQEESSAKSSR